MQMEEVVEALEGISENEKPTFFKALLLIAALVGAFYAGMRTQAYLYEDLCLDLGGSRNPGATRFA